MYPAGVIVVLGAGRGDWVLSRACTGVCRGESVLELRVGCSRSVCIVSGSTTTVLLSGKVVGRVLVTPLLKDTPVVVSAFPCAAPRSLCLILVTVSQEPLVLYGNH